MEQFYFFYDDDDYDYGALESVPNCIFSHLEEVIFDGFTCKAAELDLVAFLLEKGAKLKKFIISRYIRCKMGKDELVQELEEFPTASASVRIIVT